MSESVKAVVKPSEKASEPRVQRGLVSVREVYMEAAKAARAEGRRPVMPHRKTHKPSGQPVVEPNRGVVAPVNEFRLNGAASGVVAAMHRMAKAS